MSRYNKYLKIIEECDKALEQKGMRLLEGTVTPENLAVLERILCIMDKAWQVAWQVDRLDDISKAMGEIHKSEEQQGGEAMPVSARAGRDFRGWGPYPGSPAAPLGFDLADVWAARSFGLPLNAARAIRDALEELELEESRTGRRTYPVHSRRGRAQGGDHGRELDFVMLPGVGMPFRGRAGYDADPAEANAPYAMTGHTPGHMQGDPAREGHDVPLRPRGGLVHAPLQSNANAATAPQSPAPTA